MPSPCILETMYYILMSKQTTQNSNLRRKPFVGFNEPELTPEELEAMKKGSGLVPLSCITEYLASLPDYVPTDRWAVIGCQL